MAIEFFGAIPYCKRGIPSYTHAKRLMDPMNFQRELGVLFKALAHGFAEALFSSQLDYCKTCYIELLLKDHSEITIGPEYGGPSSVRCP